MYLFTSFQRYLLLTRRYVSRGTVQRVARRANTRFSPSSRDHRLKRTPDLARIMVRKILKPWLLGTPGDDTGRRKRPAVVFAEKGAEFIHQLPSHRGSLLGWLHRKPLSASTRRCALEPSVAGRCANSCISFMSRSGILTRSCRTIWSMRSSSRAISRSRSLACLERAFSSWIGPSFETRRQSMRKFRNKSPIRQKAIRFPTPNFSRLKFLIPGIHVKNDRPHREQQQGGKRYDGGYPQPRRKRLLASRAGLLFNVVFINHFGTPAYIPEIQGISS